MRYTSLNVAIIATLSLGTANAEDKSTIDYVLEKGSIVSIMGTPYVATWNDDFNTMSDVWGMINVAINE